MTEVTHEVTAEPIVKMDGGTIGYRFKCSCGRIGNGRHRTAEIAIERGHDHVHVTWPRSAGGKGRVLMDAAEAMNHIARAIEEAMGDPVNSREGAPPRGPWLPLSVRYAAAEAAAKVVVEWRGGNEP